MMGMKKILSYGIMAVTAALVLQSCRETVLLEEPAAPAASESTFTFTSERPALEDATKTAWNGTTIQWSAGDAIRMAYTVDGTWQNSVGDAAGDARLYESAALSEASATASFTVSAAFRGAQGVRNYTILYDPDYYASLWVAYPLCTAHFSTGRNDQWSYDPDIDKALQTSVKSGYGGTYPTAHYANNLYARGHQIPNADRNAVAEMQAQTYYSPNLTPQVQYGLNGNIWEKLEEAGRAIASQATTDTVYVVTGAVFRTVGGSETVRTIPNRNDGKVLPVPNYYYKAFLKVRRDAGGNVAVASTIGFWFENAEYWDEVNDKVATDYYNHTMSVKDIEAKTGFDLFANLPASIPASVEENGSWTDFQSFSCR